MPLFSDLRSDYPLNLTVLERRYARVFQQSYRSRLPSARAITVLVIGSNCWCPSRLLVDRAFGAQHYSATNCLNIDEQFVHLLERWCASPRGNNGHHSSALTLSSFSPDSTLMRSPPCTSCAHRDVPRRWPHFFAGVSNAERDARNALRVRDCLACLFVDSRASQINSSQISLGGAHDVSKQRSSKF